MSTQRILDTGNTIMVDRPSNSVPSNYFDLSHDLKTSTEMGLLTPIMCMEIVPGDKVSLKPEALVRFQPMLAPIMHRVNVRSEWFFVPSRLLWPNWENFISPPTASSVPPAAPYFEQVLVQPRDLSDYLGLPLTDITGSLRPTVSALQHAAYQKIYSDWYRDEDLNPQDEFIPLVDGLNDIAKYSTIRRRNWDRDYFTSAKPWAQKGPAVLIPVNGASGFPDVPVYGSNVATNVKPVGSPPDWVSGLPANFDVSAHQTGMSEGFLDASFGDTVRQPMRIDPSSSGFMAKTSDLADGLSGGTIEDLRKAEALQTFLEADSRGGTRYIETIKQHFGVKSSDARLQRAEYLGSTFQPLSISEVLQTSATAFDPVSGGGTPQGNMAGHGISAHHHADGISYRAEEHGYLIGIQSILPVTGYSQGINKQWTRFDRLDYLWPEFALLGEQPVLNQELLFHNHAPDIDPNWNTGTFGYVPRYSEYRYQGNRLAGDFQTTLDFWHLSRLFDNAYYPVLNQDFLAADPSTRIFSVTDSSAANHALCHWFFKLKVLRKLPRYVKPSI